MENYQIILDIWEADASCLDEGLLKAAGVAGLIVRLNDMRGGHHMDEAFEENWNFAQRFPASAIYFVYNPWVDGKQNLSWMRANLPKGYAGRVLPDIEVSMPGYSSEKYAGEVERYIEGTMEDHAVSIYTGEWFLPVLRKWPKQVGYWWGRYPYAYQPDAKDPKPLLWTWGTLRGRLKGTAWQPDPRGAAPGKVELWQISDKLILPGFGGRNIDINLFPGTLAEASAWAGNGSGAAPVALSLEEKINLMWAAYLGGGGNG